MPLIWGKRQFERTPAETNCGLTKPWCNRDIAPTNSARRANHPSTLGPAKGRASPAAKSTGHYIRARTLARRQALRIDLGQPGRPYQKFIEITWMEG